LLENRDRELELYSTTIDDSFLNLNASNLTSGTVPSARMTGAYTGITSVGTLGSLTVTGDLTVDTNTLRVDSTNNRVGINVTSPTSNLDIVGNQVIRAAATQDGIELAGRAGGTGSATVKLIPDVLTFNRTLTLPNVDGTVITTGNLSSITSVGTLGSLTVTGITTSGSFRQGTDYLSPYQGFRNAIINGDFRINQRGFTSITTTNTYGFDRWKIYAAGGTVTNTPQTFTVGSPAATSFESANFCRLVSASQSAISDLAILAQVIEDVRTFANSTVTVSFWAKASTGTPKIAVELSQSFGTGGSPSADVNNYGGQVTLSTSWARYSVTIVVPNINGKTIGTTANTSLLSVNLWTSAGSNYNSRTGSLGIQNNTFDFWGVQVERGSVATPFEQRPIGTELALCQRYYEKSYAQGTAPATATFAGAVSVIPYTTTAGKVVSTVRFAVAKRAAPTMTIYSPASGTSGNWFEAGFGNRAGSAQYITETSCVLYNTVVAAAAGAEYTTNWVASIEL
jgi:hypothetical protein